MTPAELLVVAMSEVQRGFASWRSDVKAPGAVTVYSGGAPLEDGRMPALYATQELAIAAWRDTMLGLADPEAELIWVDRPEIELLRITVADAKQTHRIAHDRFVVRSRHVAHHAAEIAA